MLLQDEESADPETLKIVKRRKREALESLAHVRDVLKGRTTVVDEEQLFSAEAMARRHVMAPQPVRSASPAAPPQASVVDSRPRNSLEPMSSFMPSMNTSRRASHSSLPRTSSTHTPWTNFSSSSANSATLPRMPPPTSTALRSPTTSSYPPPPPPVVDVAEPSSKVRHDPLGVL